MRKDNFYIIIIFSLFFYGKCIGQTISDSTAIDSVQIQLHERTKSLVMLGMGIESFAIITYYPIPYLGIGHFYLRDWGTAFGFLSSELGLLFAENQLQKKVASSNNYLYPDISNDKVFYKRDGLDPLSFSYNQYAQLTHFINYHYRIFDLFSAYREFHRKTQSTNKIIMDDTSIPSLMISPFKPKYLTNPWVFLPMFLGAGIAYLGIKSDKPLVSANEIMMFNNKYTTTQAALLHSGINAMRYLFVATGEEMLFRGVFQTELMENNSPQFALWTSTVAFGLYHVPHNGWQGLFNGIIGGLYLGYRYQSNGYDLGEVIAVHFWLDFIGELVQFIKDPSNANLIYGIRWEL